MQQQVPQQHQQPQPVSQQMASLANVLGPLLQQPGMQSLSNINLGSLLSQGAAGHMPQLQANPQQQPLQQQQQQPLLGQLQVISARM